MKTLTIDRKGSGAGNIHDIASDIDDRNIEFRAGSKYAVVLAAYYGGKGYTTHRTEEAAVETYNRVSKEWSCRIINRDGDELIIEPTSQRLVHADY